MVRQPAMLLTASTSGRVTAPLARRVRTVTIARPAGVELHRGARRRPGGQARAGCPVALPTGRVIAPSLADATIAAYLAKAPVG